WHFPSLGRFTPNWLHHVLYPMGKPNMDPPRVVHFLAALVLIARFLPRQSAELSSRVLRPFILCGQHSLPIFCFGVLLSFAAHWFLVQVAGGDIAQILVSIAGIAMTNFASEFQDDAERDLLRRHLPWRRRWIGEVGDELPVAGLSIPGCLFLDRAVAADAIRQRQQFDRGIER